MKRRRSNPVEELTPADLIVLAHLAEQPTHGYQIAAALERQAAGTGGAVGDAPAVSRAQTYYSLKKLERQGLIQSAPDSGRPAGPQREPYRVTATGRKAMHAALSRPDWARDRPPIPFHTWLVLVAQGGAADRAAVLAERRAYLDEQIARQSEALAALQSATDVASAATAAASDADRAVARAVASHALEVFKLERNLLEAVEPMLKSGSDAAG